MANKKNGAAPEENLSEAASGTGEAEDILEKSPEEDSADTAPAQDTASEPSLEDLLAAEHDKYLRLAAEYDNYRKRSQKERDTLYGMVRADTITKFLPVYDNLSRALAQQSEDAAFYKGVEMIFTQLREIFDALGVTEIPAVGEIFDPTLHDAVMHIEDESYKNGEIIEEFQKGFKLGDKVIRFSIVKTAN